MVTGTLMIAMIFFAARGFFLGLPGVFARLLGLISGYIVGFCYRTDVANLLAVRTEGTAHPLILQVISGALLFFGTMLIVSLLVHLGFEVLAKVLPPLRGLLQKEAIGSRISGAVLNAGIAALLVMGALYIYGLTLGKHQPPDELQQLANRLGDTLVEYTLTFIDDEDIASAKDLKESATEKLLSRVLNQSQQGNVSNRRQAEASAGHKGEGSPQLSFSLDQLRKLLGTHSENMSVRHQEQPQENLHSRSSELNTTALNALLNGQLEEDSLQALAANPDIRKQAMQYFQANPQQMMEALNNPNFRRLLEQWESEAN